jgi:hypothetical protein
MPRSWALAPMKQSAVRCAISCTCAARSWEHFMARSAEMIEHLCNEARQEARTRARAPPLEVEGCGWCGGSRYTDWMGSCEIEYGDGITRAVEARYDRLYR